MVFKADEDFVPTNVMDRWIMSFTQSLITFVQKEMEGMCRDEQGRVECVGRNVAVGRWVMQLPDCHHYHTGMYISYHSL